MNIVPEIGKGRGLFEIFVPGVFLLLNLGAELYVLPIDRSIFAAEVSTWISVSIVATVVAISFGYLLGILLRVARANEADRWSALFLRIYKWPEWRTEGHPPIYLTEGFPFIESLKIRCHRDYPNEAAKFFDDVWGQATSGGQGQAFFNFCKIMVTSEDDRGAAEIYAAEALTRYMASICYALTISLTSWVIVELVRGLRSGQIDGILILLITAYALATGILLCNLRLVRLKEVETVFAVTFKNRDLLFASRTRT